MLTSTQITAGTTLASSASSSHSSGSGGSLFSGTGGPCGNHLLNPSRIMPERSDTLVPIRVTSSPKEYVLPGVEKDGYILYAVAGARVYHSTQLTSNHTGALNFGRSRGRSKDKNDGSQWIYSHLKGTLVFGRDRQSTRSDSSTVDEIVASSQGEGEPNGEWWFQLVDEEAGKIVWKFKLPLSRGSKFAYELDRPFFHVFQGSSRKYGFLFDDDKESVAFSAEVTSQTTAAVASVGKPSKGRSRSLSVRSTKKPKSKEQVASSPPSVGISAAAISSPAPQSFKHVAHIGFNKNTGAIETSKNLGPAFREIMADLQRQTGSYVSEAVVLEHLDFVQDFWKDIETIQRSAGSRPVAAN
ncbi:hypothetical protein AN958_07341 [Leucoagaricus sp. SymC.cos]|nr:hypothetical protein AN958_07341 [Leucoagaricus sp. SymC.cos]